VHYCSSSTTTSTSNLVCFLRLYSSLLDVHSHLLRVPLLILYSHRLVLLLLIAAESAPFLTSEPVEYSTGRVGVVRLHALAVGVQEEQESGAITLGWGGQML
jgi:hypothetical protein